MKMVLDDVNMGVPLEELISGQKQKVVFRELQKLKKEDGIIQAEDVVEAARPKSSPLHRHFTWDDSIAGHLYRIRQARALIAWVRFIPTPKQRPIRAIVSLRKDRARVNGGYRNMVEVLSDPQKRRQLLREALDELEFHRQKYGHLRELAGVYAAVQQVKRKI